MTSAKGPTNPTNTDVPACTSGCNACTSTCNPSGCVYGYPNTPPNAYADATNWCGHAAGIWMSGKGPAANTLSSVSHAYFGTANGPFQQWAQGGTTLLSPIQNWGSSVVDFTLAGTAFDTSPSQYFTPSGGIPVAPTITGTNPVSYTFESLNQNDWDMAICGALLFDDLGGNHRLVTCDKAGYGYLLTQGNLCGSGSATCFPAVSQSSGGQAGLTSGDPGDVFPFGVNLTFCQDETAPDACHRVTSLAFYKDGSPKFLYLWPYLETLTALQLSDNTAQTGVGSLSSTTSPYTSVTLATENQVIPGDNITVTGRSPQTVTAINSNSTQVSVAPGFGSAVSTSTWQYNGYFINPIHDSHPLASNVQYPGGTVIVTSNAGSDALVWGLANIGPSTPGAGALYAYDAGSLQLRWCSNATTCTASVSTFTNSTFALPTVANGYAYIPTSGIALSGTLPTGCAASPCSGVLVYTGH